MSCPDLPAITDMWECGQMTQVCTNAKGQQVQVHRTVGFAAPSAFHVCANNMWTCHSRSQWAYLAEGKECGSVMDQCGTTVELFACPRANDRCQDHKCICHPHTFPSTYSCGSQADGCGTEVIFGAAGDGSCPHELDICIDHTCCRKKTVADFDAAWECGSEFDGCGGQVDFGTCTFPSQCNENHTCFEPEVPAAMWASVTGNCIHDGACLSSSNFPQ